MLAHIPQSFIGTIWWGLAWIIFSNQKIVNSSWQLPSAVSDTMAVSPRLGKSSWLHKSIWPKVGVCFSEESSKNKGYKVMDIYRFVVKSLYFGFLPLPKPGTQISSTASGETKIQPNYAHAAEAVRSFRRGLKRSRIGRFEHWYI